MECLSGQDWFWPVYWFGALVYGGSLVAKLEVIDIVSSFIAGLFWPVSLPARVLRRVMR